MNTEHWSKHLAAAIALAVAASVAACTVGPDYQRPSAIVPADYKEDGWKVGQPNDAAERGAWWAIYSDPVLDGLEREIDISNQNIKSFAATYRQAVAVVSEARSAFYPTLSVSAGAQRSGQGGAQATAVTGTGGVVRASANHSTLYNLTGDASWTPDLWGRIRRTVESDVANAQLDAADLANARLSAQAQLATAYFNLRAADELKRILDTSVVAFTQSLQITRNQQAAGVAGLADVITAKTQLETTQAQDIAVGVQRAQFEHAIAVLVGKPPSEFSIAPVPMPASVPVAPPGVPSSLLERRPDIAAAERQMAATNAQIGIVVASFYPDLTLTGSAGFDGFALGSLIQASNAVWSVGAQLAQTVFEGGLRTAQVEGARAGFDQAVALYRQAVLTGFQQVEDELAALRILAQQAEIQAAAVRDAREAERLTLNQYQAGTVPYTSVITAQQTALQNEQTALTVLQNRLIASVALIQALGGGWDTSQLPTVDQIKDAGPSPLNF
jgi:NodT family efflux transporter outer membrane factor (OMF) lipoprotein